MNERNKSRLAVRILCCILAGLMILGSVFLATTGAEALYSDMGHVGRENIYTANN